MLHQKTRIALAIAAVLVVPFAAPAGCKRPRGSPPPETNVVYVQFVNCSAAEPDRPFDVQVGNEIVRVSKDKPTDTYWKGRTQKTFAVGGVRKLKIAVQETPKVRTACDVQSIPFDAGSCVALYQVKCEALWLLNVAVTPRDTPAKISYVRKATATTVVPCDGLRTSSELPGAIRLGTESIFVTVEVRKGQLVAVAVPVQVSLLSFSSGNTAMLVKKFTEHVTSENSANQTSRALTALSKSQSLLQLVKHLEFTTGSSPP